MSVEQELNTDANDEISAANKAATINPDIPAGINRVMSKG